MHYPFRRSSRRALRIARHDVAWRVVRMNVVGAPAGIDLDLFHNTTLALFGNFAFGIRLPNGDGGLIVFVDLLQIGRRRSSPLLRLDEKRSRRNCGCRYGIPKVREAHGIGVE